MIAMNIWLVEDDADYRRMLSRTLKRSVQVRACRAFPSCLELFAALDKDSAPDIVLMDLGLPLMNGVEGIKNLAFRSPNVAVIALTVSGDKRMVLDAVEAGASGYLLKSAGAEEIGRGLREVYFGGSALSPAVARVVLENMREPKSDPQLKLASREVEVLRLLAKGQTVKEIAAALDISQSTVSTYLGRIYGKLEVQSQSAAVAKAIRGGVI